MSSENLFADRYVLERLLGRGGMAEVHLARDVKFDRLVALKLFTQSRSNAPGRARFLREATVAGRLIHQNIVTVYDFGEHGDTVFISMEYIDGQTLGDLIRHDQPETLREQLSLMAAICEGLAVAHDAGILHRDLKPDNLMLTRSGTLKILDFGIARALGATGDVTFAGSPHYMSPEQLTMSALDVRSDVFAAGAVFYEMLTFVRAFPGEDVEAISRNVRFVAPVPIRQLRPDIDARVTAIVERALDKDRERRYPDVRAMQRDIRAVLHTLPADDATRAAAFEATREAAAAETISGPPPPARPYTLSQRVMARVLDGRARRDYLWLALAGSVPIVVAAAIGAFSDTAVSPASPAYAACLADVARRPVIIGYGSKLNWWPLFAMLPFALFMLRRIAAQLFPVDPSAASDQVALLRKIPVTGRAKVTAALYETALDPRTLQIVAVGTLALNMIDVREIVQHYLAPDPSICPRELDWTVQFIADPSVSLAENALLVAVAYPCEFLVHGLGILVVALMLRHNLFYLSHVYQRHRARRHPAREQLVLDFDDPERCFGLREMHSAFNFQIVVLIAGGLMMMTSRIVNVDATPIGLYYESVLNRLMPGIVSVPQSPPPAGGPAGLFPDFGQVILATGWMITFVVVALPSALKFLPLIYKHVRLVGRREYLLEFVPESTNLRLNTQEEVDRLADKFSRGAFWPAGDERARVLYTAAYFVFLFLLVPAPPTSWLALAVHALAILLISFFWMKVTFGLFRRVLATIDATLVHK